MSRPDESRWLPWALLGALGWLFVYADRAVLSPLLHSFGQLFHVGPAALGLISTIFFVTYTAVQIPAGRIADRVAPKYVLGVGYVGFGLLIALTALSPNYLALLLFSALAGLFQGVYYPTQFAVTARRIPKERLPLGNSVITSGMGAGIAVGYVVASLLGARDWRLPVAILGTLTILVGVWLYLVTPKGVRKDAQPPQPVRWRGRFGLLLLLNFCSLYPFFFLLAWLPYNLADWTSLKGFWLGALAAWPTLVAVPATIFWSRTAGVAAGRLRRMRLLLVAAMLSLLILGLGRSLPLALLALTLYGLSGKLVLDPMILSEVAASLPSGQYGQAFGVLNFVGMIASVAAPGLSGVLIAHGGGFLWAYLLAAAVLLLGLGLSLALRPAGQVRPLTGTNN